MEKARNEFSQQKEFESDTSSANREGRSENETVVIEIQSQLPIAMSPRSGVVSCGPHSESSATPSDSAVILLHPDTGSKQSKDSPSKSDPPPNKGMIASTQSENLPVKIMEMSPGRNSKVISRILHSPSDPSISILHQEYPDCNHGHERSKSMSYLSSILTDKLKLEAFTNLQRRSVEPEVFIFPSRPYIPLSESYNNTNTGHVNTAYSNSNSSIAKKVQIVPKPTRLSRISSSHETSSCLGDGHVTPPDQGSTSRQLLYGSKDTRSTVKIDYDTIFSANDKKKQLYEKQPPHKMMRSMSIGEKAFRKVVRQVSRKKLDYRPKRAFQDDGAPPPKNYFDLALFTCCCCISPLGLIALFFSVRTDTAYEDGATRKSERYSHVSLVLSLLGIGMTLCIALIVLLTKFYVYNEVAREGLRVNGGT